MNGEPFVQHYARLREFLGCVLTVYTPKDKLSRLPQEQLYDVSTDLFDEINRRLENNNDLPFLPDREDLLPKRNQARQKMATLNDYVFMELASEVHFEIEKRFPHIASDYNAKYGYPPLPSVEQAYLNAVRGALTRLRQAANAEKSTCVLPHMLEIFLICKSLTRDAESFDLNDKKRIGLGVEQLTEKSISLMNATREHVTSGGGTRTADQIEQLGDALFDGVEELVEVMKACWMDQHDETYVVPTPQPDSARDPKSPLASSPPAQETKHQDQEGSEKNLQEEAMSLKAFAELCLKAFTEGSSDLPAEQIQELAKQRNRIEARLGVSNIGLPDPSV